MSITRPTLTLRAWNKIATGITGGTMDKLTDYYRFWRTARPTISDTTISSGINSEVTSIPLASVTGFPTDGADVAIVIGTERITYTGISTLTLTGCVRGAEDSTAAAHLTGAAVSLVPSNELRYKSPRAFDDGNQESLGNTTSQDVYLWLERIGQESETGTIDDQVEVNV